MGSRLQVPTGLLRAAILREVLPLPAKMLSRAAFGAEQFLRVAGAKFKNEKTMFPE